MALGQADAGFVYVTDARAVEEQVTVIRIPAWAQPRVRYEIAVVSRLVEEGGRSGVDQNAALGQGPGGAQELRLPAASQSVLVDALFRAALVLATGAVLLFLTLPVVAVFLQVPLGRARLRPRERLPPWTRCG